MSGNDGQNQRRIISKAFVLINCELGSEKQVISDLKAIECVKNAYEIFGIYDILINLECDRLFAYILCF